MSNFKMTPGRGNFNKTGHGLPSPLRMDGDPITEKTEVEKTKAFSKNQAGMAKAASTNAKAIGDIQGIAINAPTGEAKAKGYEKSLKSGAELGLKNSPKDMFITDSAGKIVKRAEARNPEAVEKLKKEYEKNKTYTETARSKNANYYNVTSGAKKDLTPADKAALVKSGKAVVTKN